MTIKYIVYFFVVGIVFGTGDCFSNDSIFSNERYSQNKSLYSDDEEANRMHLKQIELDNEIRTKAIAYNYEKQQFEIDNKIEQKKYKRLRSDLNRFLLKIKKKSMQAIIFKSLFPTFGLDQISTILTHRL